MRARGSSHVEADVEFAGISVLPELVLLLEDVAKGIVPFDTVSHTSGQLGLFFFHFPMKVTFSTTTNQLILKSVTKNQAPSPNKMFYRLEISRELEIRVFHCI